MFDLIDRPFYYRSEAQAQEFADIFLASSPASECEGLRLVEDVNGWYIAVNGACVAFH